MENPSLAEMESFLSDSEEIEFHAEGPMELQAAGVPIGQTAPLFRLSTGGVFQLARDGKRFLTYESEGGQQPDRPVTVVQNWAAGPGK